MNRITSRAAVGTQEFGKACLMTSATSASPELTLDDALVASATRTAADDQAGAAAHDRAATAALRARRERRQMAVAWTSLVLGLAVSLGVFSSIAWHDSVSARGGAPAAVSTAP